MPPRTCATCRYFVPSDPSCTGECGHPARQAISGLVIVRAQELACRRGLHEDDWTAPLTAERRTAAPSYPGKAAEPLVAAAMMEGEPAAAEIHPSRMNGDRLAAWSTTVPAVVAPTDAVLRTRPSFQEVPALVQSGVPDQLPRRELNTDGIPIVRKRSPMVAEAHRAAQIRRERELTRKRAQTPASDRAEAAAPTDTPEPARHRRQAGAAEIERSAHAGGRPNHSSMPKAAGRPPQAEALQDDELTDHAAASVPATTAPAPGESILTGSTIDITLEAESGTPVQPAQDQEPAAAPMGAAPSGREAAGMEPSDRLTQWGAQWLAERRAERPEQRCGTCRDFRAAENLERGWCGCAFAQSYRQFVQPDDLACLGPVGSWWSESDAGWQAKTGPTSSAPTPLADGLIQILAMSKRSGRRR